MSYQGKPEVIMLSSKRSLCSSIQDPSKPVDSFWDFCFKGEVRCASEKAMAPHSNTRAWKIPRTEEPGGLQSMESLRVGHD